MTTDAEEPEAASGIADAVERYRRHPSTPSPVDTEDFGRRRGPVGHPQSMSSASVECPVDVECTDRRQAQPFLMPTPLTLRRAPHPSDAGHQEPPAGVPSPRHRQLRSPPVRAFFSTSSGIGEPCSCFVADPQDGRQLVESFYFIEEDNLAPSSCTFAS